MGLAYQNPLTFPWHFSDKGEIFPDVKVTICKILYAASNFNECYHSFNIEIDLYQSLVDATPAKEFDIILIKNSIKLTMNKDFV